MSETATFSVLFRNRAIQLLSSREYHARIHSTTTDTLSLAQVIPLLQYPSEMTFTFKRLYNPKNLPVAVNSDYNLIFFKDTHFLCSTVMLISVIRWLMRSCQLHYLNEIREPNFMKRLTIYEWTSEIPIQIYQFHSQLPLNSLMGGRKKRNYPPVSFSFLWHLDRPKEVCLPCSCFHIPPHRQIMVCHILLFHCYTDDTKLSHDHFLANIFLVLEN